ncbi:MAG: peptidylprolyl isomerase [Halothiobacillaceae bacterium]
MTTQRPPLTPPRRAAAALALAGTALFAPYSPAGAATPAPAASSAAAADNPVVAVVDGRPITRAQVLSADPAAASDPAAFSQTLQRFINTVLLYQAAIESKLQDTPAVTNALETQRQQTLVNAAEAAWFDKNPITEQQIRERYEQLLKTLPKEQWRLREIIVTDAAQAQHVIERLKAGERFSDLASSHPDSPNSALGGEIGWVNPQQLPAPVEQALVTLQPGQITGPIVVPQGLAIVQLLARRATVPPPLAAVKPQIEQQLRNESLQRYLQILRQKAKIDINQPG